MTEDGIIQYPGDPLAHQYKAADLIAGKVIFRRILTGSQVREHRLNPEIGIFVQSFNQRFQLRFCKPEPVHAGIQLDVDPHLLLDGGLVAGNGLFKPVQDVKIVYFGFQVVLQQGIEALFFGTHHHDREADAGVTQLHPFVGIGHRQVIDPVILEHVGDFKAPAAVGEGLHHGHRFRSRPKARTEIVEVVDQGIEVDLHDGFMGLLL